LVLGWTTVSEVAKLGIALSLIALILNFIWPLALFNLTMATLFLILITNWYFLPNFFSSNRFFAVASNLPFFYFLYSYSSQVNMSLLNIPFNQYRINFFALVLLLPLHSYEFARKNFLPHEELEGYQTYSVLIGFKWASVLSFLVALVHAILVCLLFRNIFTQIEFVLFFLIILSYFFIVLLGLMNKLKSSTPLEKVSGFYFFASSLIIIFSALFR
jgi:hypothetical protein